MKQGPMIMLANRQVVNAAAFGRALTLGLCAVIGCASGAQAQQSPKDLVKEISRFVTWPEDVEFGRTFRVCVRDDDPAIASILEVEGSEVQGQKVSVHTAPTAKICKLPCHVIYFSEGYAPMELLLNVSDRPVLTISPQNGFAMGGGLIEVVTVGSKTRLRVDKARAIKHPLTIRAPLLEIAEEAAL